MERGRERESERERGRRGLWREEGFSVFILNIPRMLDKFGLQGICRRAGRVWDTYIPTHSNRRARRRYGFVRFASLEDARRCIKLFDGAIIRGCKLIVRKARPKKQNQQDRQGQQSNLDGQAPRRRLEWRPKKEDSKQNSRLAIFSGEGQRTGFSIRGEVNRDNEAWLKRSLVGTVDEPRDLASLHSALICDFDPCLRLSALSSLQFLLIFPSEERMEEAMNQKEALLHWFSDIKKWGMEDRCEARKTWLKVVGVPPQAWSWENFKSIAELWGKFVCLGKPSTATESFEVMKVCVVTKILKKIESEIILSLGSCGYRVFITEADTQNYSLGNNPLPNKENDFVPGFEDVQDHEDQEDHEGSENESSFIGSQHQRGEEEAELPNSNLKTWKDQESPRNKESRQASQSLTRTKTVSFSCIGDSEDLYKSRKHCRTLAAQDTNDGSSQVSQPPPGFEFESQNYPVEDNSQTSKEQGFLSETSEQNQTAETNKLKDYKQALLKSINCSELDQNRCEANYTKKSQRQVQEPASSKETGETSESLKKLAHESIQIGEILGVKVTGDYEAAISRITKPLKKNRSKEKRAAR